MQDGENRSVCTQYPVSQVAIQGMIVGLEDRCNRAYMDGTMGISEAPLVYSMARLCQGSHEGVTVAKIGEEKVRTAREGDEGDVHYCSGEQEFSQEWLVWVCG